MIKPHSKGLKSRLICTEPINNGHYMPESTKSIAAKISDL